VYQYRVINNKKLTPSVRVLTLECLEDSGPLLFQPGQYAAIGLRDRLRPTVMRCFSITTSPTNQQLIQFSMRVKGRFTSAIERLKVDDLVALRGPFGGFVFNPQLHEDVVLFAGGIGIAPFMSMMHYATDLGLPNKIHLVFSCRDQNDIPFLEAIRELQGKNPNLKVTYIIGAEDTEKLKGDKVITGQLNTENISQLGLNANKQTSFVCGPPAYMKAVFGLLKSQGIPKSAILSEAFSQGSHRQTGKLKSWPFNIYALTGISFLVGSFVIVALDLYKTIPKLESKVTGTSKKTNVIPANDNINSIKPQVNTNINQKDVVQTTPSGGGQTTGNNNTTSPAPTPTVKPSPTTTPKSTPTSTVS
jgi:ferredoxin-NADP reductase